MTRDLNSQPSRRSLLSWIGCGSLALSAWGITTSTSLMAQSKSPGHANLPTGTYVTADANLDLVFLSGAAALDLYHRHPHVPEDEILPDDVRAQTHMTLRNINEVLRMRNLTWRNVVKVVRYQKDIDDSAVIEEVMKRHFKDWWPANIAVQIERLSAPSSLVELEMIAVAPRAA